MNVEHQTKLFWQHSNCSTDVPHADTAESRGLSRLLSVVM